VLCRTPSAHGSKSGWECTRHRAPRSRPDSITSNCPTPGSRSVLASACAEPTTGRFPAKYRSAADDPVIASGTLNLVLANQNGFVIAADSRMSANRLFPCAGGIQAKQASETGFFYCDDSQKLFRAGTRSAMVINGFAVGGYSTLRLAVSSALRRRFGPNGFADNRGSVPMIADWGSSALEQALVGVAALYDPSLLPESNMTFGAIYAGFNNEGRTILRHRCFVGVGRLLRYPIGQFPNTQSLTHMTSW